MTGLECHARPTGWTHQDRCRVQLLSPSGADDFSRKVADRCLPRCHPTDLLLDAPARGGTPGVTGAVVLPLAQPGGVRARKSHR
jgi:hypothetical protein